MRKLDTRDWEPRRNIKEHDLLLCKYCQKHGGTTFTNVKLPDDPYPNPREIDGIRFPSHPRRLISWSRHREHRRQFEELLSHAQRGRLPVEIIEVTTGEMDRGTVGQVIVGGWLLKQRKVKVTKVLVCDSASTQLREFFKQHHIVLWSPEKTDQCPKDAS
jgi:hypothetical protein